MEFQPPERPNSNEHGPNLQPPRVNSRTILDRVSVGLLIGAAGAAFTALILRSPEIMVIAAGVFALVGVAEVSAASRRRPS